MRPSLGSRLSLLPMLGLVCCCAGLVACGPPAAVDVAPGLVFTPASHELGGLAAGGVLEVVLPWQRVGPGEVQVLGTRPDCGCAEVDALPRALPAGSAGGLRLRLAPRETPGPFQVQVRVFTDAPPPSDRVVVRLRGHVGTSLAFTPQVVELGRRSPGQLLRREVEVRWDEAPDPGGLAALSADLRGMPGTARVRAPLGGTLPGCLLTLAVVTPERAGPFQARASLRAGRRTVGAVLVRGVVE